MIKFKNRSCLNMINAIENTRGKRSELATFKCYCVNCGVDFFKEFNVNHEVISTIDEKGMRTVCEYCVDEKNQGMVQFSSKMESCDKAKPTGLCEFGNELYPIKIEVERHELKNYMCNHKNVICKHQDYLQGKVLHCVSPCASCEHYLDITPDEFEKIYESEYFGKDNGGYR